LIRILEGHEDLLRITSEFPRLGKLPALGEIKEIDEILNKFEPRAASAAVAVVVVVVCVAVAARPGAITDREILRAKLLDVYTPREREALRDAIKVVQKNPELIKATIGIEHTTLGKEFMKNLDKVQKILV